MVGRQGSNGDAVHPYLSTDIGMAEWGIRHSSQPFKDNNFWDASYRDINGGMFIAPTTVARVMGLRQAIAWEALFLYADRHIGYEQSPEYQGNFNSNRTTQFQREFYNIYKDVTPVAN